MQIRRIHALQETQSIGIHDVFNAQGLAMYYRENERILYSKAKVKGWMTSFLMFNILEAKIFQYDFLEGNNV